MSQRLFFRLVYLRLVSISHLFEIYGIFNGRIYSQSIRSAQIGFSAKYNKHITRNVYLM